MKSNYLPTPTGPRVNTHRRRFGLAVLILSLGAAGLPETVRATITINPWVRLFQGVDFATAQADASEVRMHKVAALRVDLADPKVEFFSTPSNGIPPFETVGQTTTTFADTYQVAAGVNANFFSPVNTTPNDPRELNGLAISQGTMVSGPESNRPMLLITRSNTVVFTKVAPTDLSSYWTAVAGSDLVVLQGTNAVSPGCVSSFCDANPRTALGVSQEGRYLFLLVIDGRQPGWSDGATLSETAEWLRRFGCWEGLNLDGGGSSAMAVRTNGSGSAVLMNRPSGGVQRVNGNHLGFFAQPLSPTILAQPAAQTVIVSEPVSFNVLASGAAPLHYQWRFNGASLLAATNSSYFIPLVQKSNAGSYSVTVSNAYGKVNSSSALLNVLPLPSALVAVGDNRLGQINAPWDATNLLAVAAGGWHSLALGRDGRLIAWGLNSSGQCAVPGWLTNALAIAAGGYHSLAIDSTCKVVTWGANDTGQLTVPSSLSNVWAISAGVGHSMALQRNGEVSVWGDNSAGQCNVPAGLSNVIAVSAGGYHSLALKADGTVVGWGDNLDAQGNYVGQSRVPEGLSQVVAIAAGGWHSLARKADGTVVGWGENSFGQATPPAGLTNVAGLVAGAQHSLALLQEGRVVGWGHNWYGQCTLPVAATNMTAMAAGNYHTLAIPDVGRPPFRTFQPQLGQGLFSMLLQSSMRRE